MMMKAKNLRPGDMLIKSGKLVIVKETDNVDGFIEIVTEGGRMWFTRWDREYDVMREDKGDN